MKKILFSIPLLGICSTLLAQAPTVTNVQAEQVQGTKDVSIQAEFTGKNEGPDGAMVHGEVWFKENEAMTTWTKVSSIHGELTPGNLQALNLFEWNPDTAQSEAYPTIDLGQISDTPVSKTLVWKAGDDAPNINTSDAKIRIIAFYPKMLEDGVTEKPMSEQTSGWNGEGNFGGSGGSPDGNGTGSPDGNGSSVDSDGDGFSDEEEINAGSDPYNPSSFPGV